MSFALLSGLAVLLGVALLAIGLWFAQRLRVQHREVEVLSTLFWQAAIEETRARVFVRRFRHWPAWLLLVAIASLLWMLIAQPQSDSLDRTQHVVLLDWSVDDSDARAADLQLAIDRAATLPTTSREIIAVGNHLETLLAPGEPIELTALRAESEQPLAAGGIDWAIESLSARASADQPLAVHVIGDSQLEQAIFDSLRPNVAIYRVNREPTKPSIGLKTFGVADSASGQWNVVDAWISFAADETIDPAQILITIDDQPITRPLEKRGDDAFQLSDIDARGGTLAVQVDGTEIGSLTLPLREPIRVAIEPDVPDTLRQLIALDNACQIVESDADVRVGSSSDASLRLTDDDQPAFRIESDHDDPHAALNDLIDELALQQIDATSIADQSGKIVDVQVATSDQRSVAIWKSLFTSTFDFQESRACPIFVARSIRWLANRPPLVPWAEQGERLPVAASDFDRATESIAIASDGRTFHTTRLIPTLQSVAAIPASPAASLLSRLSLYTWLGLIVSALLAGEWILYQRGRMP